MASVPQGASHVSRCICDACFAGCGASTSQVTTLEDIEQQRDPEDYILDPIHLQVTKIEEFDQVFTDLSNQLNRLIELNNNVHLSVGAVKAGYAPLAGGFEMVVSIEPATDIVLLDIHTSRSNHRRPAPDLMQRLLTDRGVTTAAAELESARSSLHKFLSSSSSHVGLKLATDGSLTLQDSSIAMPAELQHVNSCMAKMQSLLGSQGHVSATVKPAAASGTNTISAQLCKRSHKGSATLVPVDILDVCSSPRVTRIKQAEAFLVERAQHLAQRIKGLDLQWEVVSGCFVVLGTDIPNNDIHQQVIRLLQAVNIALFKLLNAGASASAPASLTNAVVELVRPVCTALREHHANLKTPNLKSLISVKPSVLFTKGDGLPPSFAFNLNIELNVAAGIPNFPDCLPEQPKSLLADMDNLVAHILGALKELPEISEYVDALLEQATEFYELCPEAASRRGLSMMEAVKCSKATGSNLRILYNTQELF